MQVDDQGEPGWVSAVLDARTGDDDQDGGRTVRAEFLRRVRRADLGDDEDAVRTAGILALDGRLGR